MIEGWELKALKSIGRVQTGTTPSTSDASNYGFYIPFVKPAHFQKNGVIDSKDSMLSESGLAKGRLFEAYSVLMVCIGATIGKTGFTTIPVSSNQQINALTPTNDCDCKFLYYGMISSEFQKEVLKIGTSSQATLPIINKSKWENLTLPIPPLSEQKQIVAILDKAFELIDQAKANIEKNIENAKELFQSKLDEVFSQKGEGWVEKRLGELGETQTGSTPSTKNKALYGDFIPFAKPPHFRNDGTISTGESMLSEEGAAVGRCFREGSVYMVCIGATLGKTGYSARSISCNQQINVLSPLVNHHFKFLYYAILTQRVQNQVVRNASQATLPILNKTKWNRIIVRVHKSYDCIPST